jgi:DNA topoisomerase-1
MISKKLSHAKLIQANRDPRQAAKVARLTYVNDHTPGFKRIKKGKGFTYTSGNKVVRDKKHLERIKKLAIPPSWTEVWVCRSPNGHIQATGLDLRQRKQYRYHPEWNRLRSETKFHHLYEFGKLLPRLRKRISRDILSKKLTREKVLAAAINLMEKTYIRIGSESYEKLNGSYGLTTLKDQHVLIQRDEIRVSFSGKKGVEHNISLKNKRLARIVKQCRDIPGKALFQYYDAENKRKPIDSTLLNNYIKEATAPEFSAKDIRTWAGSVQAITFYLSNPDAPVNTMIDWVSEKLGNTRNVCKKYYIHPSLVAFCEEKKQLPAYKKVNNGFSESEELLMCILKKN